MNKKDLSEFSVATILILNIKLTFKRFKFKLH